MYRFMMVDRPVRISVHLFHTLLNHRKCMKLYYLDLYLSFNLYCHVAQCVHWYMPKKDDWTVSLISP